MKTYSEQELANYQDIGATKTQAEANRQIARARRATPEELRAQYRSYIRFDTLGCYHWGWVLR